MYAYDDIKKLHLELTDMCNAACPQCPRNDSGGAVNPMLPLVELTLADLRAMLPEDFVTRQRHVYACGNYGDPIMAQDTLEIFAWLRALAPDAYLGLHTNGSARQPEWWAELGKLLPYRKGYVRFSIDGLEDTNPIYRRNTRWATIMRNAEAFVAAGGNAEWDFLVFRHNEHQVDEARARAKRMGFTLFTAKATSRFLDGKTLTPIDRTPVKNETGQIEYWLERPLAPQWNNEALVKISSMKEQYGDSARYLSGTPIRCKAAADRAIYVTADGLVLPCCWLGARHYMQGASRSEAFAQMIADTGGLEALDAKRRPLRQIIEGPLFQERIPTSWAKPSLAEGRIQTCAWICGELTPSAVQWKNKEQLNEGA